MAAMILLRPWLAMLLVGVVGPAMGAAGCARCDAPPFPDASVVVPPPPPPVVIRDAAADVPDASDAGPGPRAKKPEPAPRSGGGGFKVEGSLAKADAEKIVRAGYGKLRACNPDHKGKVTFRLTVDDRGRVSLGEVVTSTLGGDDTEMCMIRATRDFKFPASGGESKVSFQMSFGK